MKTNFLDIKCMYCGKIIGLMECGRAIEVKNANNPDEPAINNITHTESKSKFLIFCSLECGAKNMQENKDKNHVDYEWVNYFEIGESYRNRFRYGEARQVEMAEKIGEKAVEEVGETNDKP